MGKLSNSRFGGGLSVWGVLGWFLFIVAGMGLVWLGFIREPAATPKITPSPTPTLKPLVVMETPTYTPSPLPPSPTPMPAPTETPAPTATSVPPTPTSPPPIIVAGADGVNVRSGPGTNYTRLGYLDPSTQANLLGRYGDWWQIQYEGNPAWVFGDLVTASNADGISEVAPPPSPTPAPVTAAPQPTAVPPTATPASSQPSGNARGIVVNGYMVEGSPGPYNVGQNIWFNMDITNTSGEVVEYNALGTWVEETGQYQKSWTFSSFQPNENLHWRDHLNIPAPGSYNLWLVIQFKDGGVARLSGPIPITVQ